MTKHVWHQPFLSCGETTQWRDGTDIIKHQLWIISTLYCWGIQSRKKCSLKDKSFHWQKESRPLLQCLFFVCFFFLWSRSRLLCPAWAIRSTLAADRQDSVLCVCVCVCVCVRVCGSYAGGGWHERDVTWGEYVGYCVGKADVVSWIEGLF